MKYRLEISNSVLIADLGAFHGIVWNPELVNGKDCFVEFNVYVYRNKLTIARMRIYLICDADDLQLSITMLISDLIDN